MIAIQRIKMKKTIITTIVLIFWTISICSAYMEDKVFCTISKNSITVTLEKQNNYKCSEYISVLSQAINTESNDILSIQKLINQWYDVDYRKEIRDAKRDKLKKMLTVKWQIEAAVSEFDANLFVKLKDYIIYTVSSYQTKYKKVLKHLNNLKNQGWAISSNVKKKMDYLQEDITVIDKIIEATGYEVLMNNFNRHLYLKNQIEWK